MLAYYWGQREYFCQLLSSLLTMLFTSIKKKTQTTQQQKKIQDHKILQCYVPQRMFHWLKLFFILPLAVCVPLERDWSTADINHWSRLLTESTAASKPGPGAHRTLHTSGKIKGTTKAGSAKVCLFKEAHSKGTEKE